MCVFIPWLLEISPEICPHPQTCGPWAKLYNSLVAVVYVTIAYVTLYHAILVDQWVLPG